MIKFLCLLLLACCLSGSLSLTLRQTSLRKSCPPKPPTVKELNATRYIGDWYQAQGLPAFFQPSGTKCLHAQYGLNDDGTVSVKNTCVNYDGSYREICGYAETPDPEFPGELEVHFPGSAPKGDYWLIETDYDNYASVYSCFDVIGLVKFEFAWLLTRERVPPQEVVDKGLEAYTKNGISLEGFEIIDQGEDCFYENPDGTSCDE